jgi:hypothetical protein
VPKGKDADRWNVKGLRVLRLVDCFVPEMAEVVLQPRESALYVELSNRFEGLRL